MGAAAGLLGIAALMGGPGVGLTGVLGAEKVDVLESGDPGAEHRSLGGQRQRDHPVPSRQWAVDLLVVKQGVDGAGRLRRQTARAQRDDHVGKSDRRDRLTRDAQQHRGAVPGQRPGRRAVTGQHHRPPDHPAGQSLGGVGEHLALDPVAQRLGVEFVGQRRQVGRHARVDGGQRRQTCGEVAAQAEVVGHPQSGFEHRCASGGGIAERDRWMKLMGEAMQEVELPEALAGLIRSFFAQVADMMRNREG